MKFIFKERRCDVERDKRIKYLYQQELNKLHYTDRSSCYCSVAHGILMRANSDMYVRKRIQDFVTNRINSGEGVETFTDCNKREAYKFPFKYIDKVDGTYQVFDGFISVQLVGENYADPQLNVGADYHTIRLIKTSNGSIDYWYEKYRPFLLNQINVDKTPEFLEKMCADLNELKANYLDNIEHFNYN